MTETLLFDSRGHHRVRELVEGLGVEVLVTTLESGDINFLDSQSRTVGIELKTIDDLLGSIRSNRLFQQATQLALTCDIALVLPFGFLTCTREGHCRTRTGPKPHPPWPAYTQLMNAILSLWEHGITVLPFVPNEYMAARVLVSVRKWFLKEDHRSMLKRVKPFSFGNQDSVKAIHILTGCPRISVGLAKRLLAHFGTALAVLSATEEELRTVRGIGKVIARSIHSAARAEYREE